MTPTITYIYWPGGVERYLWMAPHPATEITHYRVNQSSCIQNLMPATDITDWVQYFKWIYWRGGCVSMEWLHDVLQDDSSNTSAQIALYLFDLLGKTE